MAEFTKPGWVTINGVPVIFSTSITADHESGDNRVNTNLRGMDGHSDGAHASQFTVNNAIPITGYEIDAEALTQLHTTISLGFKIGSTQRERKYTGRILSANVSTSPDRASEQTFRFEGKRIS